MVHLLHVDTHIVANVSSPIINLLQLSDVAQDDGLVKVFKVVVNNAHNMHIANFDLLQYKIGINPVTNFESEFVS